MGSVLVRRVGSAGPFVRWLVRRQYSAGHERKCTVSRTFITGEGSVVRLALMVICFFWSSADGKTWERLASKTVWKERHEHSAYVFKDKLCVAGGHAQPLSNEVWSLAVRADWSARGRKPDAGNDEDIPTKARMPLRCPTTSPSSNSAAGASSRISRIPGTPSSRVRWPGTVEEDEGVSAYSSVLVDPAKKDWPYEMFCSGTAGGR